MFAQNNYGFESDREKSPHGFLLLAYSDFCPLQLGMQAIHVSYAPWLVAEPPTGILIRL